MNKKDKFNLDKEVDSKGKKRLLEKKLTALIFRREFTSRCNITYTTVMLLLLLYAFLLLSSRLLTLMPDYFTYISLLIPISIALITGTIFRRKAKLVKCAKLADETYQTKDLFYTAAKIDNSYGEYTPILLENAEEKAKIINPREVIPFHFGRQIRNTVILLLVIAGGIAFLPQLDPFGKVSALQEKQKKKERLAEIDKAVRKRLKTLKKESNSKHSTEVEELLSQIKRQFNSMKKSQPKSNREKLKQMHQNLSEMWRKKQQEKLRDQLQNRLGKQSFGMLNKKEQNWQKKLKKNDFSALKKEAEELREMAQKISEMSNSAEKEKMKQEFRKRIKDLAEFMSSQLGSKSAQGALKNAMTQLDMSNLKGLDKDALNAMRNSMQLFKRELERLEEIANDINQLEMAMQASQLAEQLNKLREMQGAEGSGLKTMEDYADFYKKMMASQCCKKGKKNANGGGSVPEENKNAETEIKKEISKSQLQPGKILMKWNTKGMGKTGKANETYRNSVKKVKQSVSEAILKEQVPPGYHESIQKYFDNIGN
jgi:hypothetical protein